MPRTQSKTDPVFLLDELKTLYEISSLIQDSPIDEESYEEVLKLIGRLVDFRSASLYILSGKSGRLREICSIGRTVDLINFVNFNMGTGISAWVAEKKRSIILNNLRKSQGGSHTKSFLAVPLVFAGEIKGVINLAHDEPDAFSQRDAEMMGIVSSLVSLLVERVEHTGIESEMRREIESLKEEINAAPPGDTSPGHHISDEFSSFITERVNNSLAIIAGNAQFLLMTMKNPGNSVTKRLKAIDTEASNLISAARSIQSPAQARKPQSVSAYGEIRN